MSVIIAPSILSANFSILGEEVHSVEKAGADWIHLDVMDGHFVPALTFGAEIIKSLKQKSTQFFDTHLMISNPDQYIQNYADAGSDCITVHAEACIHLERTLKLIRSFGKKAGVAVNPSTPVEFLQYIIDTVDLVLIMTVNPGFGGQKYLPLMEQKIKQVQDIIDHRDILIEVDGGINDQTIKSAYLAGATVFVAGSYIFRGDYKNNIEQLRNSCQMATL